jgi:hypothetical protein
MTDLDEQAIDAAARALKMAGLDYRWNATALAHVAIAAYLAARGEGKETPDEPANG